MNLVLDTGILGQLCHPAKATNQPVLEWVDAILKCDSDDRVYLPEVCDYELRRKLLHLIRKGQASQRSLERLEDLVELLDYLPIDTSMMRQAAEFWSDSRARGKPTSADEALDGDVILAAQALAVGGTVVTANRKHLSQFVPAHDRADIFWAYAFVCIRGPVDNLAFDWKDHFFVQDTQGRTWNCRREATWHTREEMLDTDAILGRLTSDLSDVGPMYQKLFKSGHATTNKTTVIASVIMAPIPSSTDELIVDLAESLGEKSDDKSDSSPE